MDPTNAGGFYIWGRAFEKLNMLEEGIRDFTTAMSLDPNHINAAYAWGACENKWGNYDKAIEDYNIALCKDHVSDNKSKWWSTLSPEPRIERVRETKQRADWLHDQGYQAWKKGDFNSAIRLYTEALQILPTHFKALFNRGFAYDKVGEYDKAIADYT